MRGCPRDGKARISDNGIYRQRRQYSINAL